MMKFFFQPKRIALFSRLSAAFPAELPQDVEAVCKAMSTNSNAFNGALFRNESSKWKLPSGEMIKIPYRIYVGDSLLTGHRMTDMQRLIYHCIFSRSYDGYLRQKHIEALLTSDLPDWAIPYVIKICDEYVKEILEVVYQTLQGGNNERYKALCALNLDYFKLGHSRMISYWNEFYRYDCYRYNDYVGKKLYSECFGYNKTGQKAIKP